ncbi:MAG: hypothetical protein WCP65_00265 [Bacteroidota bacterium]
MVTTALALIIMAGVSRASSTTTVFNSDGSTNTYVNSGDIQIQVGHYDPNDTPGYTERMKQSGLHR